MNCAQVSTGKLLDLIFDWHFVVNSIKINLHVVLKINSVKIIIIQL